MPQQRAEALFDFNPTAAVELGLKKGDVIAVRHMDVGEGWWEGELNGLRGLFPCSYVKLLPMESPSRETSSDSSRTPLTPGISKKAFMETLLAPPTISSDQFYSKEKSSELFIQGHSDISVTIGPSWDCCPPTYSITVRHQSRHSGLKHWSSYVVDTKELASSVTRKFKNFLGLYDRMAEVFPCVSLPPLPVKQFSGARDPDGVETRRRGLERFLERVSKHPVLCSTKIFYAFLTAKDDKDWKIGRHYSIIKLPKSAKKLFGAPVYSVVKYPAYNVPLNQLASIDKFSKFSRLLEVNVQTLQSSYLQLSVTNDDMLNTLSMLGKDIQRFTRGMQPTAGAQRHKLTSSNMATGLANGGQGGAAIHVTLAAPTLKSIPADTEEDDIEEEGKGSGDWNWREDSRFSDMTQDMYDIAGDMRQISYQFLEGEQDALETQVVDVLRDYSGIIHTLPVLVKLHEEAMETYDASKEKDSKKEAEEVRQQCDTLNNVLLAEFDFFSKQMIDDFEEMMESFLCRQANYHRQLAKEWDTLHRRYKERLYSRRQSKTCSSEIFRVQSGSFTPSSFASSQNSISNLQDLLLSSGMDPESTESLDSKPDKSHSDSIGAKVMIPTYINVERRLPNEPGNVSESDLIDPEILKPKKKRGNLSEDDHAPLGGDLPASRSMDEATPPYSDEPESKKKKTIGILTSHKYLQPSTSSSLSSSLSEVTKIRSNSFEQKITDIVSNYSTPQLVAGGNETTPPSDVKTTKTSEPAYPQSVSRGTDETTPPITVTNVSDRYDHQLVAKSNETTPPSNMTMVNVSGRYEMACPQFLVPVGNVSTEKGTDHDYANLAVAMGNKALTGQRSVPGGGTTSAKKSPILVKKPMPIQRKWTKSSETQDETSASNSCVPATTTTTRMDHHSSSASTVSKKPIPPAKPPKIMRLGGTSISTAKVMTATVVDVITTHPTTTTTHPSTPPVEKPRPLSSDFASSLESDGEGQLSIVNKPRSYTCVEKSSNFVKKQPILPPSLSTTKSTLSDLTVSPSSLESTVQTILLSKPHLTKPKQAVARAKGLGPSTLTSDIAPSATVNNSPSDKTITQHPPLTGKGSLPVKPLPINVSRGNSHTGGKGYQSMDETSPKERDELMRKLSLRRLRIEAQIIASTGTGPIPNSDSSSSETDAGSKSEEMASLSGERNSLISSSHSEVVVAYHTKKLGEGEEGSSNLRSSSHGASSGSYVVYGPSVILRKREEEEEGEGVEDKDKDDTLVKYGILEDEEGGSYLI